MKKHQQLYVDIAIKHPKVRACISSKDEDDIKKILNDLKLVEDKDYKHQFCLHDDDIVIVVDFLLVKPMVIIEADGSSHKGKAAAKIDKQRDRLCQANGYSILRIKTPLTKEKKAYWFRFFRELLTEDPVDKKPAR